MNDLQKHIPLNSGGDLDKIIHHGLYLCMLSIVQMVTQQRLWTSRMLLIFGNEYSLLEVLLILIKIGLLEKEKLMPIETNGAYQILFSPMLIYS